MQTVMPPARILLVDDKPQNLLALEAMLDPLHLDLVPARSADEALRHLLTEDIAVILLDVHMPRVDGLETAALIRNRERSRTIPIIFLTAGDTNDDLMVQGYALGAVDYIVKPIQPEILRSKVMVFVELFRKTAQIGQQAAQLAALNEDLERRVKERTSELERTVRTMKEHIAERKRAEDECALLLVREQAARRDAEIAEQRAAFLAEASALLDASFDYTETLKALATRVVPELSDLCTIDVATDEHAIEHIADVAARPADLVALGELRRLYPPGPDTIEHPVVTVLRSGEPLVVDVSDDWLRTIATDTEHLRRWQALGLVSFMVLPLRAHGRVLGTMTCAMGHSGRRFGAAEIALAVEVGRRAGQAVDNALLYRKEREAVHIRDDFLSVASHELKTPITSLHVALQTLGRVVRQGLSDSTTADRIQRMLDIAELQDKRLIKLVNDLLDVSRIAEGRLQLDLEEVDLTAIVEDVVERFREEIALAGCTLSVYCAPHVVGLWDHSRLEQVVTNLLTNALKYGAGTEVHLSVDSDATTARLVVADHGIGIASQHLGRIFERFERAVTEGEYSGVGLGLYIVRQIVGALGGEVTVISEPGKGATFSVELPLRVAAHPISPQEVAHA